MKYTLLKPEDNIKVARNVLNEDEITQTLSVLFSDRHHNFQKWINTVYRKHVLEKWPYFGYVVPKKYLNILAGTDRKSKVYIVDDVPAWAEKILGDGGILIVIDFWNPSDPIIDQYLDTSPVHPAAIEALRHTADVFAAKYSETKDLTRISLEDAKKIVEDWDAAVCPNQCHNS